MKARNLRKSLIVLLTSLFMVLTAFTIGLSGAFSVKAEDYTPTETEFYMLDGAQVSQVSENGYGMRFTTKISKAYYKKLDNIGDVRFYTTIGPLGFTPAVDNWKGEISFDEKEEATIYGVITYGKITDSQLKEKAAVELTAKAYVKVTPDNGDEAFTIEAVRNDTTRSMRAVANMALHDDEGANEDVLLKYLGSVDRETEVQQLSNRDTVVTFDKKVNGRVFLNGVRTNLFVNNQNSVDIAGYINWDRVDASETITVSVFGENGTSVYDVVSKDVNYELEVFYKDKNGNVATDYKILLISTNTTQSSHYVIARHLIELTERGLGITDKIVAGEQSRILTTIGNDKAKNATLNDKYIVIGTQTDLFKKSGLRYDKEQFTSGGYVVAVKGNCIFLYGGDETSSTTAKYGNYYAVQQFMSNYFDFEVTGVLPTPVAEDEITSTIIEKFGYSYDDLVYTINESDTLTIKTGVYNEYFPDIENRSGNYGTYTTTLTQSMKTNGGQSETIMSAYSITFEDYLKMVGANAITHKAWQCNHEDGHLTYSVEKPTVCANAKCVDREDVDFTDITKTVEAYRRCYSYYCLTCGKLTMSFVTPETCLANFNTEINKENHSCSGTDFVEQNSASWHTAGHVFPVMNNLYQHSKWFGDDVVYACSNPDCNKTYAYYDYHDVGNGGAEKAESARDCSMCTTGVIEKYYGASITKMACDYEDCGAIVTDSKEVGKTCEKCREGTIVYYKGSTDADAVNEFAKVRTGSDRVPNKKQPCFTAHGDPTEYKLMVAEAARKVLNNIKYLDVSKPDKNVFAISDIDGTGHCGCDACIAEFVKYGTMASTQIKFINDLSKFIDRWMLTDTAYISSWMGEADVSSWWMIYDENEKEYVRITDMKPYQRKLVTHFFAYMSGGGTSTSGDRQAPVKVENGQILAIDPTVEMYQGTYASTGVYLVTSSDSFENIPKLDEQGNVIGYYTYEEMLNGAYKFNGTDNIFKYLGESDVVSAQQDMKEWSILSNGTRMYLWVNTQSSNYTTVPYYSANLFDENFFTFMQEAGVDTLFCYASSAEPNAVTAFNNLKLYVTAKRMWDTDGNSTYYKDEDGNKVYFTDSQEYLDYLYETWFKATFVYEDIISSMKEAFNQEMTMAVRANYLQAHSKEKYNQDLENGVQLGNSQSYTSIMGHMGEYWDVSKLITLYNTFKSADDKLNQRVMAETGVETVEEAWDELDKATKLKYTKIKAMLYSEWYAPLVTIMRYYQNDAKIIPLREEYVEKFKEIIDLTGIKYNAEYAPPTAPTSDMVYYTTQLEVVIFDFTDDGVLKESVKTDTGKASPSVEELTKIKDAEKYILPTKDGKIVDTINGVEGVVVYDPVTGELNLFEGERYRVLLRVTEDLKDRDGKVIYTKGSYIVDDADYFGYQKNVNLNNYGRLTQDWPTYFSLSKGASMITTGEGYSASYYNYSTASAFLSPAGRAELYPSHPVGVNDNHGWENRTIAGKIRTVAVNCDELNIHVGMGVTNWAAETVYTIRINLVADGVVDGLVNN